jgi:hypothetical protein
MRNRILIVGMLVAVSLAGFARQEESVDDLKARVESARPEDRPALCIEIAQRQVEAAAKLYAADNVEAAQAAISDVVTYSDKASDAAIQTGKKMKQTEITIRKMAARLRTIHRSLPFEEQAPVQAAADHLEDLRTKILARMFPKDKTP